MLLVPRQLQRVGMTGDVPYYGGRLSPAQAYAASHPRAATAPAVAPRAVAQPVAAQPVAAPSDAVPPASRPDPFAALDHLLEAGVITSEEYADLRARVTP